MIASLVFVFDAISGNFVKKYKKRTVIHFKFALRALGKGWVGQKMKVDLSCCIIGHFRVPKTLTFKMRPSAQPFL